MYTSLPTGTVSCYVVTGWFWLEEETDLTVTAIDKISGEVLEEYTLHIAYSEEDAAYRLTLVK